MGTLFVRVHWDLGFYCQLFSFFMFLRFCRYNCWQVVNSKLFFCVYRSKSLQKLLIFFIPLRHFIKIFRRILRYNYVKFIYCVYLGNSLILIVHIVFFFSKLTSYLDLVDPFWQSFFIRFLPRLDLVNIHWRKS